MGSEKIHVMLNWGKYHDSSIECWCEPELTYEDEDTGGQVWTHRRGDN